MTLLICELFISFFWITCEVPTERWIEPAAQMLPFHRSRVLSFPYTFTKYAKCEFKDLFKDEWSYFSKFRFLFHLKDHSKDVDLKFCLKWSSSLDVRSNSVYAVVCILLCLQANNYGYRNQAHFQLISPKQNTFQLWNLPWVMREVWAFLWYPNL